MSPEKATRQAASCLMPVLKQTVPTESMPEDWPKVGFALSLSNSGRNYSFHPSTSKFVRTAARKLHTVIDTYPKAGLPEKLRALVATVKEETSSLRNAHEQIQKGVASLIAQITKCEDWIVARCVRGVASESMPFVIGNSEFSM